MKNKIFLKRVFDFKSDLKNEDRSEGLMTYNHITFNVHVDSRPEDLYTIYLLESSIQNLLSW